MDVEILLHGVPSGQDYYGVKEEQKLAESFYTNSNESVKLVVEARKNGNTPYVYYTYLRYKNIVGAGGRSGSYIGITLRLDMYYLDVVHMYNMLDMAFKKYIIGALLTPTGESYKYVSPDFTSKKLEIEQLQQGVLKLIETTCVFPKFVKIDNSFINQITNAPTCNIADITEGTMSATIKKYSKIILSPDYKSNLEKEYEKKVQDAEGRGGSIVAEKEKKLLEKDKTIAQKDTTITNLNTTISSRDTEIATLKQEIKRKDQELAQNKQKGEISQLINKVREPIIALSEYFHVKDSELRQPTPKFGKKNFYMGVINSSLLVLVLAALVVLMLPKETTISKEIKTLKEQINQLQSKLNERDKTINELRSELEQNNSASTTPIPTPQRVLKIDVQGYSRGNLSKDRVYTIVIKDGTTKYTGKGNWSVENATIVSGKKSDAEIKIKPTGNGTVKLMYNVQDSNYKVYEQHAPRTFNVTTNTSQSSNSVDFEIVVEPKVEKVEVGKEYTFSIKGYDGTGVWGVDGFSTPVDKEANTITVQAIEKKGRTDTVVVSYTPTGGSKKRLKLSFEANE